MGKWIPLAAAVSSGILFARFAEPNAFRPAADALVTFSSFVAAAVVPTMILAATILRPARFGLAALRRYRSALREQINFFAGVILVAALLIATLIAAELLEWKDYAWTFGSHPKITITSGIVINAALGFLSVLLSFRIIGFVVGVRSLFELHFEMIEQESADQVRAETDRLFKNDEAQTDPRKGFGRVLKPESSHEERGRGS